MTIDEILALPSSTCLNGLERRTLDLNGWGSEFNAQWNNNLLLDFFCFHVVKPLMPILPFLLIPCVCEKLVTMVSVRQYGWLTVATYEILKISLDFKIPTQNVFQVIQSNFDFLTWVPPPPPHTMTTENEITPDLAWHKLGPQIFFSNFCLNFCSNFFFQFVFLFLAKMFHQNKKSPKFKLFETKMHGRRPCLWPLTKFWKFHWISKIPKQECISDHYEQLWFFGPGPL